MQSMKKDPNKPTKLGVWGTAKYVYGEAGFKGLYRGVTPRICLGVWQTICMVALGDVAKVSLPPPRFHPPICPPFSDNYWDSN